MAINNRDLLILNGFMLLFLLINFNRDLGIIYIAMLLISWSGFFSDKFRTFTFSRKDPDWVQSIIKATVIYTAFMLFSGIFMSIFHSGAMLPEGVLQSVLKTFANTTPVLAGSFILTLLGWGIIVPQIETDAFFATLFEYIGDKLGINLNKKNFPLIILIVAVSFIFALFHLTAKGVTNNAALSLTFIFAFISLWLVVQEKQTKTAVVFHMIANVLAVSSQFGYI